MEDFPFIQTNVWDALLAIPAIVVMIELLKIFFPFFHPWIPLISNSLGLIISVFMAHRYNLYLGIVMGIFYGYAAIGVYETFNFFLKNFRNASPRKDYK